MSAIKNSSQIKFSPDGEKLRIKCPICGITKNMELIIPKNQRPGVLRTILIEKGAICSHSFLIMIDNDFKIRGYQKIHFILNSKKIIECEMDIN